VRAASSDTYLRKRQKMRREGERRDVFERYIGEIAKALNAITGEDAREALRRAARAGAQEDARSPTSMLDEDGKVVKDEDDDFDEDGVIVVPESDRDRRRGAARAAGLRRADGEGRPKRRIRRPESPDAKAAPQPAAKRRREVRTADRPPTKDLASRGSDRGLREGLRSPTTIRASSDRDSPIPTNDAATRAKDTNHGQRREQAGSGRGRRAHEGTRRRRRRRRSSTLAEEIARTLLDGP
jgi:hypothetical protein